MWVRQYRSVGLLGLALMGWVALQCVRAQCADAVGGAKPAEARKAPSSRDQKKQIEDVARRIFAITDVVLDHHIESPTRQEMILAGLRSACAAKKISIPDLGRRVSDLKTSDELTGMLSELWPRLADGGKPSTDEVQKALFDGLLRPVSGSPYILPAKEARVQAQIQANRYVGLGIALSIDDKSKLPQIRHTQAGGSARLGGVQAGDLIEQINQNRVAPGARIAEIVDKLRGPEGTEVTIRVRQPDSKASRTLTLVRLPVMFKSVKCSRENDEDEHVVILSPKPAIAYLKIDSITASTARELASWEPRLREAGIQGLILDLRGTGGREGFEGYHSALLLADSLLDGKPLGKLRTRDGVREFNADRDCLLRDVPLAILIDKYTNGPASWVAAALQDSNPPEQRHRHAVIVGTPGGTDNFVRSTFPLPDGDELVLANGVWQRPNAHPEKERMVRFYSMVYAIGNPSRDWKIMEAKAKFHREGLTPDAYIFLIDPRNGIPDVEMGPVAQSSATQAYPSASGDVVDPRKVQQNSKRLLDSFEQAAISELERQIELAGQKQ